MNTNQIQFHPPSPLCHGPSIIQRWTEGQAYNDNYRRGLLYADGSCSCSTYKASGTCRHTSNYTISDEEQTQEDASYRSQ